MRFVLAALAVIGFVACSGAASAERLNLDLDLRGTMQPSHAGLKDLSDIPAPIPLTNPIPEGFTYYLRTDLAYGFNGSPSYSEHGRTYGAGNSLPFLASVPFGYGGSGFAGTNGSASNVFSGGIGFGAYLSPSLRGDITIEFRGDRNNELRGTYAYTATNAAAVSGRMTETFSNKATVGLVNMYWDLLPRGRFSPYIGAGFGAAYNEYRRDYISTETSGASTLTVTGADKDKKVGWAGALMAGITFAFDHRWAIDVNYRALYLQGGGATLTTSGLETNQTSRASIGDSWEHQIRAGLRFNIW